MQEIKNMRAICDKLKFQIKVGDDIQEDQGGKQPERDTVGVKYVKQVCGKEFELKPAKLKETAREIQETANVIKYQLQIDEEVIKNKIWRGQALAFKTEIQKFYTKREFQKINDLNQRKQHPTGSRFSDHITI